MIFLCFRQNAAQKVDNFGNFFPMRPVATQRPIWVLATPALRYGGEQETNKKLDRLAGP